MEGAAGLLLHILVMEAQRMSQQLTTIKGSAKTRTESVRAGDFTIRSKGAIPLTPMSPPIVFDARSVIILPDCSDHSESLPQTKRVIAAV
jgi:hypothetical protein